MIDLDFELSVSDRVRRFDLCVKLQTDAPFTALFGPSGAGKTLTLKALAGLHRPSRGHIRIDGRTLFDEAAGIDVAAPERRIGYLFQDYALFPHLSVYDNVAFGLRRWFRRRLPSAEQDHVQSLLESFELDTMRNSRPQALSGGQQQRVALARALACQPTLLLLDEPFASLNAMLKASLREDLAEARRRWGIPALMITHDVEDVLALADVAFVYEAGHIARSVQVSKHPAAQARSALAGAPLADWTPHQQCVVRQLAGVAPDTGRTRTATLTSS